MRHMNFIDHSEGVYLSMLADIKTGRERMRLLRLAAKKLEAALMAVPNNYETLHRWGDVCVQIARMTAVCDLHLLIALYDRLNCCSRRSSRMCSCSRRQR